jgi:hypothetical protein
VLSYLLQKYLVFNTRRSTRIHAKDLTP